MKIHNAWLIKRFDGAIFILPNNDPSIHFWKWMHKDSNGTVVKRIKILS